MKHSFYSLLGFIFLSYCFFSCLESSTNQQAVDTPPPVDSLKTRATNEQKTRISVKEAFFNLSKTELLLEGILKMSKIERKNLVLQKENEFYNSQWVGNYLKITEKPSNTEDKTSPLEQIKLAAFNSIYHKNILFISQELINQQRNNSKIVHQGFFQFEDKKWAAVDHTLPEIITQTFFENQPIIPIEKDFIYFELSPLDVNYLQAHLIHEAYPDKDFIAQNEIYKVAFIWNGEQFKLNRQAMIEYDISEHHIKN